MGHPHLPPPIEGEATPSPLAGEGWGEGGYVFSIITPTFAFLPRQGGGAFVKGIIH